MNADRLKADRSCLKLPIHPFIDRLTEQIRPEKIIILGKWEYFFYQTNFNRNGVCFPRHIGKMGYSHVGDIVMLVTYSW